MQKLIRSWPFFLILLTSIFCFGDIPLISAEADSANITIDINENTGRLNQLLFGQNILISNGLWNTRTDSVDVGAEPLIKALSPSILRFPGGSISDSYIWEDGVGVRTVSPVEQNGPLATLNEAPNWRGITKARFLDTAGGQFGDPFTFLKNDGNELKNLWGNSVPHAAGTVVRPENRSGQPDWMINNYGIFEHMRVAKAMASRVIITVNYGTGLNARGMVSTSASLSQRIKRAAAFVAFCNGSASDQRPLGKDDEGNDWKTIGYWAGKRVNGGASEPFGVTFWEIGNEVFDQSETGHTTAKGYARDFVLFSRAMKSVDPGIKTGAAGISDPHGRGALDASDEWNSTLVRIAGSETDFLVVHPYYPAATRKKADYSSSAWFSTIMAAADQAISDLRQVRAMLDSMRPGGKFIPLAITEYGIWPLDSRSGADFSNMASTVFDMDLLASMVREGPGLRINIATAWNLHGSNQTALIRYDWNTGTRLLRPQYYAFQMVRGSLQPKVVSAKVSGPTFRAPGVANVPQKDVPTLNALATLSEDGKLLSLMVINRSLLYSLPCAVKTPGFTPGAVNIQSLSGPQPGANNETNPNTLLPKNKQQDSVPSVFTFPPHSITVIEFKA